MTRHLGVIAGVIGILSSAAAEDVPRDHGAPPRLLIASGIDAEGNLVLSATEQRQKKVSREVEQDGKKATREVPVSYPVTVLNRQTVSVKDATIRELGGKTVSLAQARERLKEPTPVLLAMVGEKIDPIYLNIMKQETLTFTFPGVPEFKEVPRPKRKGTVAVGENVPDFSVRTLDGKTGKLSELQKDEKRTKTGVVVLSFWCSSCSSCRRVEHDLDKLSKEYAGQAAVIALDANAGETAERVAAFAKEKGLALPIVLDPGGRTADVFGVEVTTTTVVIDGKGLLRYCGRFGQAEAALKAVLAGKEVAVKTTPHDG
jgi:thiol-disulfide isomerase/thioredoxin